LQAQLELICYLRHLDEFMKKPRGRRRFARLWTLLCVADGKHAADCTARHEGTRPATQGGQSSFANAWSAVLTSYRSAPKVVGNHCYAVVGYDAFSGNVTVFNPWGIENGLLTLSWSDVVANFQYFDRTA